MLRTVSVRPPWDSLTCLSLPAPAPGPCAAWPRYGMAARGVPRQRGPAVWAV